MAAGAFILGSTGLCGYQMLRFAEKSLLFDKISTVGRKLPDFKSEKVHLIQEADSDKWPEIIEKEAKGYSTFFSGLGSTIGAAGSAENFERIDYGINYAAAKAAKKAGVQTFVLISAPLSNANSRFLYIRTKGKLEDDIIALKFARTIILRPGILLGEREKFRSITESIIVGISKYTHGNFLSALTVPAYGEEMGQIAVNLALEPIPQSQTEPIVNIISAKQITNLAKKL